MNIRRFIIGALTALLAMSAEVSTKSPLLPHITDGNLASTAIVPTTTVIKDPDNIYWSIFSSDWLGFHEFWVSYSHDALNWSRPLYTGIPVLPSDNYQIKVGKHQLDFDWRGKLKKTDSRQYFRSVIDTTIMGYTIYKQTLYEDSDGDGLTDLAEDWLWTNPEDFDTDDDDTADGLDMNPLAAPVKKLSLHQRLHKYIIEFELEEYASNQLVVVEQFENQPMEYDRPNGIVLSLSSGATDAFVEFTGYGVPILTCSVKDTTNDMLKASFQFFIAPDDAWGYDLLCKWNKRFKEWQHFKVFNEWVAD